MSQPKHTNRLVHETSPYLLQHAHNPVDWYPWGPEALELARAEDKLILLSIGYSACHWCHVMERESFEDERIAELMNADFVNVKVDREERPDIDDIYMAATLAMNRGQGGWPMTVFLTPRLEPVFAGTYFPPEDRWGRPGFVSLLTRIAHAWRDERQELATNAGLLAERLRQEKESAAPPLVVGEDELRLALEGYGEDFDPADGGFGPAPKFPPAAGLGLLLRLYRRFGDEHALVMVKKTLDAMARGGIYDQVGGGFARYSTDARWLVPHFEKMLYDNALLVPAYLEAYQVTGEDFYRRIAGETLDYVLREMVSGDGGFFSATDADSEGVEGKFFVWTPQEIAEILDDDEARAFCAYYDITAGGNWEGKSIPRTPRPLEEVAEELGETPDALRARLDDSRAKVYEARLRRVAPGLDDKMLTAWNGMMIEAMARGYDVLGERRYLAAAERAAELVVTTLRRDDGGLYRTCRVGKAHLDAYLEDYAWTCEAFVTLYEAGGDVRRLDQASELAERLLSDFSDAEGGGFFNTAHDHEQLILRYRDGSDGATPSGNAVAASALARLSFHLGRDDFRRAAVDAIKAHGRLIARYPRAFAKSLAVVDFLLEGPVELALVGRPDTDDLEALRRAVARHYLPNKIQALCDGTAGDDAPPLVRHRTLVDGKAALYVCRDFACRAPVTDPAAVGAALEQGSADSGPTAGSLTEHLPGRASTEGTQRFAARFQRPDGRGFTELGATGLSVSRLGFGSYRVSDESDEHRQALRQAILGGVNLIDTSTNYTDGASERLVGSVVRELVRSGELERDEIVVVSKIGYVQGRNYELAKRREAEDRAFPDMVKIDDGLWHCLHPEFLDDQLGRSLDRLELAALDVCLLHNPEYFLGFEARRGTDLDAARELFYARLEKAFAWFESQVEAGRLGAYGVSSNTIGGASVGADTTSLARMLEAARAAGGGGHHFGVVQLPLNLFETGPVFEFNTGDPPVTALDLARQERLAVLVNRPLNAFTRAGMVRLADVEPAAAEETAEDETVPADFDHAVRQLAELEAEFRRDIAAHVDVANDDANRRLDPSNAFRWSDELPALRRRLSGLEQWQQVASQIAYGVRHTALAFERGLSGSLSERWSGFQPRYFQTLNRALGGITRQLTDQAAARNAEIAAAFDELLPAARRSASLSQKALWTVASTPGVSVVLNGMRHPEYVDDALAILEWDDLRSPQSVYQAVKPWTGSG